MQETRKEIHEDPEMVGPQDDGSNFSPSVKVYVVDDCRDFCFEVISRKSFYDHKGSCHLKSFGTFLSQNIQESLVVNDPPPYPVRKREIQKRKKGHVKWLFKDSKVGRSRSSSKLRCKIIRLINSNFHIDSFRLNTLRITGFYVYFCKKIIYVTIMESFGERNLGLLSSTKFLVDKMVLL